MTATPSTPSLAPDRSLRLQCACTLLVAVGAAYVSYRHGRDFALRFGADDTTATLWPLTSTETATTPSHQKLPGTARSVVAVGAGESGRGPSS